MEKVHEELIRKTRHLHKDLDIWYKPEKSCYGHHIHDNYGRWCIVVFLTSEEEKNRENKIEGNQYNFYNKVINIQWKKSMKN